MKRMKKWKMKKEQEAPRHGPRAAGTCRCWPRERLPPGCGTGPAEARPSASLPPGHPSHTPTRRHHSLTQASTRRVRAHGLKLPGEAQPMSVRRRTCRRRHTPARADPCGAPGTACSAKRVTTSSSSSDPDSDSIPSSSSSSTVEPASAAGVHTQFRPRVRTQPRTFFDVGKSAKNHSLSLIHGTRGVRGWSTRRTRQEALRIQRRHDPEELECQRDLLLETLLNPVPGRNLQGLPDQPDHHDHEEQESQRDLLHQTLLNPVEGVTLEDLHNHHDQEELECLRSAPQSLAEKSRTRS